MGSGQTVRARDAKQAERERLVAEMEDQLGLASEHPEDEQYISASATEIVASLKGRKAGWTVERVMVAFIRAACDAQRKTNCLTEILFQDALERARTMDKDFKATGRAEGPFWGLPSSFKDTYNVLSVDSSVGCSIYCDRPTIEADEEAGLVKLYRKAGGIPFCKTNIPQTLLAFECRNPIFGATSNPYSASRVPGGSSGGEAALITLKGTPLGWGSDIGGSLRIPAAYSGCCGLKPVRGRWPVSGQRRTVKGFEGIKGNVGPMARTVDDLILQSRTMINMAAQKDGVSFGGEPLIHAPWREYDAPKKLRIGWYTDDKAIRTSPACARAVEESVALLRNAGHEVVEFHPPPASQGLKIFAALTSADGYRQLLGNTGPDPMEPAMELVVLGSRLPRFVHWIATKVIKHLLQDSLFADCFAQSRPKSVHELWYWTEQRDLYANAFRQQAWETDNFDAIICPVQAVPALEHGRTKFLSPLCVQTVVYNVVDSTVGVLPVTRVDRSRDAIAPDFLQESPGSWILEKRVYGGTDPAYDADRMHGLPVGVQVVGPAWEEERVLGVMRLLESLVGYK
ncbi:hypothetical protein EHS25_008452 [Saitozyma podzolica]|uniref:amidase n=1 Tax=Saitozyma podzolica TaxID=1890683 RepID=A0A427YPG1_9TREE|nr:hypothetical protein EHS25_008452 [Saitozyma podzolica]